MSYQNNVFKFLFSMEDHLLQIKHAERIRNFWKGIGVLIVCTILLYGLMAYIGMGTAILSPNIAKLNPLEYEQQKFWFMVGRMGYAALFAGLVLFVPSLFYYAVTGIPYRKIVMMQQVVLLVILVERLTWIPLAMWNGLDWYVSPLSFGIIASYLTEHVYFTYFFGMISLFQIWIIGFQVKYLGFFCEIKKLWLWLMVIGLHVFYWAMASVLAFADQYLLNGWFH
ncbi:MULTISPECIES: hypothetical protein [Virgibacillus]|uniref:Yip1 domain-containing protein n=1 Tax=Virgibacillus pantothenticus TaxID=1473 RepID=A0A0L0QVP9_VIRPA|nr:MULTISPECIES: hypothetical protein [Virgibacillus]API92453.1 hypothetical protein BKP57_11835 [Virgibacillus sp. 6R]KNE22597.1 hypothetical protein AFK71_00070 [Virgibacillus pantothenticus]MBS7427296.1 hypothetical protein [Virgibacillus sp. 19R1-5]QTY16649.1 hypothetical protein KBP50_01405 [Virgibacillus pantothenticus]SIT09466.1 hypothetical protein SAMN05421787_11547 [Virgibacillus pantothenticus]